jgi:RimJ/RimL family protein N-acetyltransferase
VELREVQDGDVAIFYEYQADPVANALAGVPPRNRAEHDAHWARTRADPQTVIRAIVVAGVVVGHVARFPRDGVVEIGYRLGREYWGRGLAGQAVGAFLQVVTERPLHAVVSAHNVASRRILERHGFRLVDSRQEAAAGDGEPGIAHFFRLDTP